MRKKNDKLNEENKETRLLNTAFKLFTEKGIKDTSIQEIVDNADVGKGTFYLYFKDKYEIRDVLIAKKSHKLFNDALSALREDNISALSEQVIFIVNYVIDELKNNQLLLKFISKNLSWGIYNLFLKGIEENNIKLKNPDVTLFMIIELVSSTCFNSILYNEPLPIDEYKPYLFEIIEKLINS